MCFTDDSREPEPRNNAAVIGEEGIAENVLPAAENVLPAAELVKRTRKRQKRESKRADRKKKRNSGLSYQTKKGKTVLQKTFTNNPCSCKKGCSTKIDAETRKHAFSVFWKLGSFKLQNAYLCGLVKQELPRFRRPRDGSRQEKSSSIFFTYIM